MTTKKTVRITKITPDEPPAVKGLIEFLSGLLIGRVLVPEPDNFWPVFTAFICEFILPERLGAATAGIGCITELLFETAFLKA